ncbi:sigma-70 family RNA polymerase sigma factor [Pseudonocardia sp. KRD-184]|uniref:Sigma-70 family RNA polymerase sigma factor n=1 Tax=Pseudonocardia oceani TaxID=2792013 RepID=A0ABS6U5E6_9PSEU|nr:sigma-70 family RNA polymerase sigma factor [Pseudonocardia oceani]MBW0095287.1 sigma-70 family RNA polymerase sigma factor [Pseudonocardia oceani]MBW0121797.1 sigma-70 family RNA polymerase sigma factor [Pseudonocardia oceani]MBW0127411.1 sigma-70 family RNA polymerase sigma factor [Pseudonocardia oceani]
MTAVLSEPGCRVARVTTTTDRGDVRPEEMEQYRRELTGYCYRMLGSSFEADDAVQETLVRAWRKADGFEGRSAVRSWLYRIATNVCLDMLRSSKRRARPVDLGPSSLVEEFTRSTRSEYEWVGPVPDERVLPTTADPAELTAARESIKLAFVAALQLLPARQRSVLILREVLAWQASEVAELLETSVASVNSALQRARATLAARDVEQTAPVTADQQVLLTRYLTAFESYDIPALVSLLHEDAVLSMPPFELWLQGRDELAKWFVGPGSGCRGSRLLPVTGNGLHGFGSYRPDGQGGHAPWGIQLLEFRGDRIAAQHSFIDARLFPEFGLPTHLAPGQPWPPAAS